MSATEIMTTDPDELAVADQLQLDPAPPPATVTSPRAELPTRTVAIIKHHALDHRLDIEPRISEAGFEARSPSISLPRRLILILGRPFI